MSRQSDINIILDAINDDFDSILLIYNDSLKQKNTDSKLPVKIKNYLENARSILDYMARDIADSMGISRDRKVFFL